MKRRYFAIPVALALLLSVAPTPLLAADGLENGSFETGTYDGWTLLQASYNVMSSYPSTWGIAMDLETVNSGDWVWDYYDGDFEEQHSDGLPITYESTDGMYLAYGLQRDTSLMRMYQDVYLSPDTTTLTWDMWYTNHYEYFDQYTQYLTVELLTTSDTILETLFMTEPGDPLAIPMTGFSADISAWAGLTVRLNVEVAAGEYYLDFALDNFAITGGGPVTVDIAVKPADDPNAINLNSKGVLPVAVLTTDTFDAACVDPSTVLLEGVAPVKWEMLDVPEIWSDELQMYVGDGDLDLMLYFSTPEMKEVLTADTTEVSLTGETLSGADIEGSDSVWIVKS